MSNREIADRMSARIRILTDAYRAQYAREPEALFVPWGKVLDLIALAEDLCGRLLDSGFVLDSINGLQIRLVTGNFLGVGILSKDLKASTPLQETVWLHGTTPSNMN